MKSIKVCEYCYQAFIRLNNAETLKILKSKCKNCNNIFELKYCGNCSKGNEGVCEECFGENYGHTTEINNKTFCKNWRYKNG